MGLLQGLLGNRAKEAVQKFSGNQDFLEGLCAACAWVAGAEGGIDDDEFDQTLKVINSNSAISSGFKTQEIEMCFSKMTPKTTTRSGKSELKREITEAIERSKDGTMGQAIVLAALDVADMGGISSAEEIVLRELCQLCGQNYDKVIQG